MAKLTLAFKDRKLRIITLRAGECTVGRDPDCTLVIDSLALEPLHARIHGDGDSFSIEPAGENCVVSINNRLISDARILHEGDCIQLGKHSLSYSGETGTVVDNNVASLPLVGWLQIRTGSHLGRTIRLDKAFTRIGRKQDELAVIARRDDGYYLSALQGTQGPQLNRLPIDEQTRKLSSHDVIRVGELQVQFFADGSHASNSTQSGEQVSRQRRFSRIPFDVNATLADEHNSWETSLLDISLHGALVRTPATFHCVPEQIFQLSVHLEGGPDIRMDVEVARHEEHQLGLNCRDIDVASVTHLRRLVELNLGDPELLERELAALGH